MPAVRSMKENEIATQALAVGIKETDHSFGLLKRLNQSVQNNGRKI